MKPKQKQKRTVMRRFRLDEISAVDAPAQRGAVITLMKRKSRDGASEFADAVIGLKPRYPHPDIEIMDLVAAAFNKIAEGETDPAIRAKAIAYIRLRWRSGGLDEAEKKQFLGDLSDDERETFFDELPADDAEIARRAALGVHGDEVDPNEGVGDDPDDIPEDEEELEMSKQDEIVEIDEDEAVRLIAKGFNCTIIGARAALANAEDESPEAVQQLLDDPKVADALAQEHSTGERQHVRKSVRELIAKKRDAGELRGIKKRSAHRDAYRELYGR